MCCGEEMINLQKLNYTDKIIINEEINIPREFYEKMDIIDLENVYAKGVITNDIEDGYLINLDVSGKMLLHDSVTFDVVPYDFDVKIEETLENSLKTLDLIAFLWQYIVLEVPLRFTNSDIQCIESSNYRIISEEEYNKKNNPFSDFELK